MVDELKELFKGEDINVDTFISSVFVVSLFEDISNFDVYSDETGIVYLEKIFDIGEESFLRLEVSVDSNILYVLLLECVGKRQSILSFESSSIADKNIEALISNIFKIIEEKNK